MRISDWSSDVCSSDLGGHALNQEDSMSSYIRFLAERARAASYAIAALDPSRRAALLSKMADAVDGGRTDILAANARDMQRADEAGTTGAMLDRSEEHTSELQSLMSISYAVFCLEKKNKTD